MRISVRILRSCDNDVWSLYAVGRHDDNDEAVNTLFLSINDLFFETV